MNRAPNQRMRRVNEILREAVADEVLHLKDPRIGFLTITGVDTAPDLRNATVYFSVLGDDEQIAEAGVALESAASRIRIAVGAQVRLKYLPRFTFTVDPSIEYGTKMAALLRSINDRDARADEAETVPTDQPGQTDERGERAHADPS